MTKAQKFDRDILLLALATENLRRYDVLGFMDTTNGYQLQLKNDIFDQLAVGREIVERNRNRSELPLEKCFYLHGIEVIALYDTPPIPYELTDKAGADDD